MKIAVTGPNGRLASWLIAHHGCIPLDCDITKYDEVRVEIQRTEPDVIINCAAYTQVDIAEIEQEEALLANVRGAGNIRMAFGGRLVHISTSYVFDGDSHIPYAETDTPRPLGHYAWTKWGGEAAVLSGGAENCLIVRTVSLYGPGPKSDFVNGMLVLLSDGSPITLPDKLISNPTYVPHLAEALMWCVENKLWGTINLAGTDIVSRFEWARKIDNIFKTKKRILIRPTAVIKGSAKRPKNASLDLSMAKSMGIPLYSLKKGLKELKKWHVQNNTFPL
jgi:dTDP-4-dehydrorhamnose reductase